MEKLYTIKELAEELKVPESTLRYYRDRFEEFIPTVGKGRKRRYKKEAIDVFSLIINGYEHDLTFKQIKDELIKKLSNSVQTDEKETENIKNEIIDKQNEILKLLLENINEKEVLNQKIKLLQDKIEKMERILVRLVKDYKSFKKSLIEKSNKDIIDM